MKCYMLERKGNAFDLMRLIMASFVIISHGYYLLGLDTVDIGVLCDNQTYLGEIGLLGFFSLSGYLISKSFIRSKDVFQFLVNRVLRIMPGFWGCLIITAFVIAPIIYISSHEVLSYRLRGDWSALGYVTSNFFTIIKQPNIHDVLGSDDIPNLNGSLWTLKFELLCYLLTLFIGALGVLQRKKNMVLICVLFCCLHLFASTTLSNDYEIFKEYFPWKNTKLFVSYFMGVLYFVYEAKILKMKFLPHILALSMLMILFSSYVRILLPLITGFSLLHLFIGFKVKLNYDISYGLYIYSYPVQQLILSYFPDIELFSYLVLTFVAVVPIAFLSFIVIEKPSLILKTKFPSLIINTFWITILHH